MLEMLSVQTKSNYNRIGYHESNDHLFFDINNETTLPLTIFESNVNETEDYSNLELVNNVEIEIINTLAGTNPDGLHIFKSGTNFKSIG